MEINITGRNMDLDNSLKSYIYKRLSKLEKIYNRIYRCDVILEDGKVWKNAEIVFHLKRNSIVGKESTPDIYASIDGATDKVKKQLRRLNERLSSHRRKNVFDRINPFKKRKDVETREDIPVIKADRFADKPMHVEEAKLELENKDNEFIMFKNAETGQINVLYKRGDGKYGLVEPNL